ncbi:MAG: hypothetical protein MUQ25_08125, partial [Candidatus Aminicenantes bacterium]|nr:hypothetical protein [Candidatus Aminicenantes bacterium]
MTLDRTELFEGECVVRLIARRAYLAVADAGEHRSSFSKFLTAGAQQALLDRMQAEAGDLLLFVADQPA